MPEPTVNTLPGLVEPLAASDLVAIYLLTAPVDGVAQAEIDKALAPYFVHRCEAEGWSALLAALLAEQTAAGLAETPRRQRWTSTAAGRERVSALLGVPAVRDILGWTQLRDAWLIARVLGLAPPSREALDYLRTPKGLRSLVLKRGFALALADPLPPPNAVRDALVWQTFERLRGRPVGAFAKKAIPPNPLVVLLLSDLLESPPEAEAEVLLGRLAAQIIGASRPDAQALRLALIRRSLDTAVTANTAASPKETPAPETLEGFATVVREAAQTTVEGRFGDSKVLLHQVWRTLERTGSRPVPDLDAFKRRLVEAHQEGLLVLTRADVTGALDPNDLAQSLIRHHNAEWHFLRLDR